MTHRSAVPLACLLIFLAASPAHASWPNNVFVNVPLCTAANNQYTPTIVADGAGGAIVTWYDLRGGSTYDIYAQHVLASGNPDPAWPADGRALCTAAGNQSNPNIVADGAGGAIVTWQDTRSGNFDIYAQHVLASGSPDPAWPADGRALCTAANSQGAPTLVADGAGGAIVAWQDYRSGTSNDIYAQRVARFGYLGTPEAEIVSVKDVPNDQGGKVKLSWNASYLDPLADANLSTYDVLRSVPTRLAVELSSRGTRTRPLAGDGFDAQPGDLMTQVFGASTLYWEYLTTIPVLHYVSGYSYLAPTTGDSTVSSNPTTSFMVVARNASNTMYWPSVPASGYSVDNLAPTAPAPFTGQFAAGTAKLHWNRNTESDLAGYRLYRGASAAFVPSAGNRIASPADTGYTDIAGVPAYYKLTAVDLHGNESPIATLMPTGTTGVDGGVAPAALEFAAPSPNPAREAASLYFALPLAGAVRVTILDAAGRVVREIADGAREAGTYSLTWDLRDLGGHPVSAGLYFARLMTSAGTMTRRIAVTR